jgi:cation:H+ antiporter
MNLMNTLSLGFLLLIFTSSGIMTWLAGITLTKTTDSLDCRFKIGDAFGGLIFLGVTGSLPDIAIAFSAAVHGHIPVIIGNLLGGIAIQTLVIVIFDLATKGKRPLSYLAGSITLFFETIFAIVILILAVLGTYVPAKDSIFHMNPLSIVILCAWFSGLYLVNKSHKIRRFNQVEDDANPGRLHDECRVSEKSSFFINKSTMHVILVFLFASVITLIAGVLLEESGTAIAGKLGINSGLFAATILALVTSLPEISTGIEAILIGDNHLALSDIWGGNAFMLVPFVIADLIVKKPILSYAENTDRLFALLGIGMMGVYAAAFLVKLKRRYFGLGLDSICEILLYAGGIILLFYLKLI